MATPTIVVLIDTKCVHPHSWFVALATCDIEEVPEILADVIFLAIGQDQVASASRSPFVRETRVVSIGDCGVLHGTVTRQKYPRLSESSPKLLLFTTT